jgi:hypothetical protein
VAFDFKKVVTDRTSDGKSVFAEETRLEPSTVMAMPGSHCTMVYVLVGAERKSG